MKLNLTRIKEKLSSLRRGEYRTISAKAHHDWKIMIIAGMSLVSIAILGNIYLFFQLNQSDTASDTSKQGNSSGVVSKKNLEDTVQFFRERQARLEDLKTVKPDAADPSL